MKINESTGKLSPAAPISERSAPADTASAGAIARPSTEQVSLSGPARALLGDAGHSAVPVDTGKVTQIRQQIADGSYQINAAEIADRLITAAREMFSRRH